jgi:hypothetical protein
MLSNRTFQAVLILGVLANEFRALRDYEILGTAILPFLLFLTVVFGVIKERAAHEKKRG